MRVSLVTEIILIIFVLSFKQIERGACFGGISRLAGTIESIRNEGGNVILLDGGNQFAPTAWFAEYREKISVHFMNTTGYDAMVSTVSLKSKWELEIK